jgi:hypothetical protein
MPDLIYINLPIVYKKDNSRFQKLPSFITNNKLIFINYTEDIGPATKIIPVLKFEKNPETILISVDDDTFYMKNHISHFVYYSLKYPNSVITGSSFITDSNRQENNYDKDVEYVQFLEGFSGVLYKVKFFKDIPMSLFTSTIKACYLADDLVLSNFILGKGTSIININAKSLVKQLDYGFEEDALHYTQNAGLGASSNTLNYRACIKYMRKNKTLNLYDIDYNTHFIYDKIDQ